MPLAHLRDDPERVAPWHRYFNRLPDVGRLLLVGDAQPFDLTVPVLYNTCFDDSIFEQLVKDRSTERARAALTQRGITHVYVDWSEIDRYRRTYGFTDFVQAGGVGPPGGRWRSCPAPRDFPRFQARIPRLAAEIAIAQRWSPSRGRVSPRRESLGLRTPTLRWNHHPSRSDRDRIGHFLAWT